MPIKRKIINVVNSAGAKILLSLFFMAATVITPAAGKTKQKKKNKAVQYKMTVARIVPAAPTDSFIEVTFSESQRFYKLPVKAKPALLSLLKQSEAKGTPVLVKRVSEQSDVIIDVQKVKH
jgi:hypothetical protein